MLKGLFDLIGDGMWFYGLMPRIESINIIFLLLIYAAICAIGYLLGAVNTAIIVSKLMYGEDIRTKGSGNAGMTNMMRTYGKGPAAITFIGDLMKTLVAMSVGTLFCGLNGAYFAGLFAILGHIAPIYYRFKGGKGVTSTAMFILYVDPVAFLIILVLFVLIVWGLKFLSLGSIICAFLYPIIIYNFEGSRATAFMQANPTLPLEANPYLDLRAIRFIIMTIITFVVIYMHRSNIKRLMEGTESKFSFKKTQKPIKVANEAASPATAVTALTPKRSLHNIDADDLEDEEGENGDSEEINVAENGNSNVESNEKPKK
ncbi:MAG: glycerol-3-phosphate 1-O-acyltransferase PlsY [Clostridia bacterium]|nr:glycerol-3-phosphate 1-O-acyltransferase PlsY [Clostridia bacterium]